MSDDQALPLGGRSQFLQNVFVGETVKTVTADTFVEELSGQRKALRQFRKAAVERRIKAGDLGNLRKAGCDQLHDFDFGGQVQGSQRNQIAEVG